MKALLFILVSFMALTATLSGLMMIGKPDGSILELPLSLLQGTPFKNYLIPGILLAVLVGGTNLLAVVQNIGRGRNRYNLAMAGGFVVCGWIIVQMILVQAVHWLHIVYFIMAILIILLAYQLKGRWAV